MPSAVKPTPESAHSRSRSRRWFMRSAAASGILAASVDWRHMWDQLMRDPSKEGTPNALPNDIQLYGRSRQKAVVETLFRNQRDYYVAADDVLSATDTDNVEHVAQRAIFNRMLARVAIGRTYQMEKWQAYGKEVAKQQYGVTPSHINADYGVPEFDTAQFAVLRTQAYAAAIPRTIFHALGLTESVYVAGGSVEADMSIGQVRKPLDNGLGDTMHTAVLVNCVEGDKRRLGVGREWVYQLCKSVDAHIFKSPTTFYDRPYAGLMPDLPHITTAEFEYPAPDSVVFDISTSKTERYTEILTGRLILPDDPEFESPEQLQQELLLRRMYGTFPNIPLDYFEQLTRFRQEHEDQLPQWGGQLAA